MDREAGRRVWAKLAGMDEMGDPKTVLHHYLQQARDAIVWKLDGLSERDARTPRTPTGNNLLGVVKHCLNVEAGYVPTATASAILCRQEAWASRQPADGWPSSFLTRRTKPTLGGRSRRASSASVSAPRLTALLSRRASV